MEPTGLRDVFRCITLSIAAMEDIGLHPKPTNDPPVHRPTPTETFGLHHIPPDHRHVTDASRKSDMHKDGSSRKRSQSVMTADPQMIFQFPLQSVGPLGAADTMLLHTAAKYGNTNMDKAAAGRKKAKAKVGDPSKWKQNKQKQLRMEGKSYVSKRKRDGKVVTKHSRAIGPRCTSNACIKASNRLCNEINEEARRQVFDEFWQHMDWTQRKLYVAEQVDRDPVERSRAVGSRSRRSVSLRYHLLVDGKRKQVCKNMFLSTLGVGEWSVLNWTQKGATTQNDSNENKLEKRQAATQCPQQKPASSAVSNTAGATQEQVNATDKDKDRPPEPEGSARKKSRVAKPLTWKQNRQKQLRMEGKSYISKRKKDGTTITKGQRTMGSGCTSSACKRASNRFCADFSEDMRNELFTSFWQGMNWAQRKIHVSGLVDCDAVERTRAPWTQSRRSVSMRYHLIADGLERTPQLVLRPGAPVAAAGAAAGGQVFAPTQGQVGLPFKNIPLQNIIIQRGPGGTQTLVRPIQPKPLQAGAQTVYSLGLQSTPTTIANVANTASPGGQYTANGSIVVQPHLEQQQTNMPPGQYLLPSSLALTPANAIHNGPADPNSNALITSQNAVQIVAGQNFTASPGGQLILNQGVVSRSQGATQTWTCANPTSVQTSCAAGRLTLVGPATAGIGGQGQLSASPVQRLLVTQTQNCTSLSPLAGTVTQEQDYRQNSSSPALKQVQLSSIHGLTTMTQDSKLNSQVSAQKRPALPPLTRGEMLLQQLRKDHGGVHITDQRRFTSIDDTLQILLPYHVFQGAPPSQEEFSHVDDEFEVVATQVLMRTHSMVNKYRRLLLVEAERSSPSSEMVMIDRTFNQEERSNLTQDKRMTLVDPDTFFEDFCCGMKSKLFQDAFPSQSSSSGSLNQSDTGSTEPLYRTDSQPGYGDPGGGGAAGPGAADKLQPPLLENKSVLELKRSQQHYGPSGASNNSLIAANSCPQGNASPFAATSRGQTQYQVSPHPVQPQYPPQLTSPPHADTDSALEAAVNSILEC